jgi:hypothetical protein
MPVLGVQPYPGDYVRLGWQAREHQLMLVSIRYGVRRDEGGLLAGVETALASAWDGRYLPDAFLWNLSLVSRTETPSSWTKGADLTVIGSDLPTWDAPDGSWWFAHGPVAVHRKDVLVTVAGRGISRDETVVRALSTEELVSQWDERLAG